MILTEGAPRYHLYQFFNTWLIGIISVCCYSFDILWYQDISEQHSSEIAVKKFESNERISLMKCISINFIDTVQS
jgi:hypothetical protein